MKLTAQARTEPNGGTVEPVTFFSGLRARHQRRSGQAGAAVGGGEGETATEEGLAKVYGLGASSTN